MEQERLNKLNQMNFYLNQIQNQKISNQLFGLYLRELYWFYSFNRYHSIDKFERLIAMPFILNHGVQVILDQIFKRQFKDISQIFLLDQNTLAFNQYCKLQSLNASSQTEFHQSSIVILCVEMLSDMSNYKVYRAEMGKYEDFAFNLVKLLKLSLDELNSCCQNNIDLHHHLIERILNIMANLAFDGENAVMSKASRSFEIINDETIDAKPRPSKIIRRAFTDMSKLNGNGIQYESLNKSQNLNRETLCSYLIRHAGFHLLLTDMGNDMRLLSTSVIFLNNCMIFASDKCLFSFALLQPVNHLYSIAKDLKSLIINQRPMSIDDMQMISAGIDACNRGILYLTKKFHQISSIHNSKLSCDYK